jgi:lysozyme
VKLPDGIHEDLVRDEGEVLHAYQDHLGYWTIGVGTLIDRRKGGGITPAESRYLLDNRLKSTAAALDAGIPWWRDLDEVRQRVLLNMAYQMGPAGLLRFHNTLGAIKRGDWVGATNGMRNSLWARQTPQRAQRMIEAMRTGRLPGDGRAR